MDTERFTMHAGPCGPWHTLPCHRPKTKSQSIMTETTKAVSQRVPSLFLTTSNSNGKQTCPTVPRAWPLNLLWGRVSLNGCLGSFLGCGTLAAAWLFWPGFSLVFVRFRYWKYASCKDASNWHKQGTLRDQKLFPERSIPQAGNEVLGKKDFCL